MSTNKGKSLHLFTDTFPYGHGEQFILEELKILSREFKEVFIYPIRNESSKLNINLPDNTFIVLSEPGELKTFDYLLFFRLFATEFFQNLNKINKIWKLKILYSSLKNNFKRANWLMLSQKINHSDVFYSYWMLDWAIVLSLLKRDKKINCFYCRAHGSDLYDFRKKIGFQPYQKFVVKNANKVFLISDFGKIYLTSKYNKYSYKFYVSRLGTKYIGENPTREDTVRIVSCASAIKLKRIDQVIHFLKEINHVNIEWVYFGSGEMLEDLKLIAEKELPVNVKSVFHGQVSNADILNYYLNNHVTFLISLSETEGLPYSFMEAISFGIPILSTNVGGVPEIINSDTGIMVDPILNYNELRKALDNLISNDWQTVEKRAKIQQKWKEKFSSEKNYGELINLITF